MAKKIRGYSKTVERDLGEKNIRKIVKRMQAVPNGPHVKVGILDDAGMHDESTGVTVAQIALWNEFGTDGPYPIPERPFLRTSAEELRPIMARFSEFLLNAVISEKITLDNALDRLGNLAKSHIQKKIRDWKNPPNSYATIIRKARKAGRKRIFSAFNKSDADGMAMLAQYNNPLVDTGQMVNSITYQKVFK